MSSEHSGEDAEHCTHPSVAAHWILETRTLEVIHWGGTQGSPSSSDLQHQHPQTSVRRQSSQIYPLPRVLSKQRPPVTLRHLSTGPSLSPSSIFSIPLPMVLPFKIPQITKCGLAQLHTVPPWSSYISHSQRDVTVQKQLLEKTAGHVC